MSRFSATIRKPGFLLAVVLPLALIAELVALEGLVGISFPSDRGSAISRYEIREKGQELHFITRNYTIQHRRSLEQAWLSSRGTRIAGVFRGGSTGRQRGSKLDSEG
jgi:hypothetical protein